TAEQLGADPDRVPAGARIRADVDVPVLDLQTEGDMVTLRAHLTHQDATPHYRRWEIAGAAHAEAPQWIPLAPPALEIGLGGQRRKAAVACAPDPARVKRGGGALSEWVGEGRPLGWWPAIQLPDRAAADPIAGDERGLAKGGIRLPELEAPTAKLDGQANAV